MKKSYFRILIILAILTALALANGLPVFAADYIVTQLTDNSYVVDHPAINNGFAVWQGWDGNDFEIFRYDGHETEQLTDNSYNDTLRINDYTGQINSSGYVVWMGQPEGSGSDLEIFRYDSSGIFPVTDNSYRDESPQINDNGDIVWRGYDGSNYHIFYYDGSTITNISDGNCSSVGDQFQINSNGDVVWVGRSLDGGGDEEIFLYNGTGTRQITDNTYEDFAPQMNESGQVVYVGQAGPSTSGREIFMYDGFTSIRLTNNSVNDYQSDINDEGLVVWSGEATVGYDILLYDGIDITPIANYKGGWGQPKISNNGFVAWQGIDPNNSTDNKIYVYDGLTTIVLESNATNDRYHQINANGAVVWQAYDGNDYEIFLATLIPPEPVSIDIIPKTCPNECPIKGGGSVEVAILGKVDFDVNDIDIASVRLEGVTPIRSRLKDKSSPVVPPPTECECTTEGRDGFIDLCLKFDKKAILSALGEVNVDQEYVLTLSGELNDGTPIEGKDCIVFVKKGK